MQSIQQKFLAAGVILVACLIPGISQAASTTYSTEAIADLRFMIEEEKLARDVYLAFGSFYPTIKPVC